METSYLDSINTPDALRRLPLSALEPLAAEIRQFLLESVSKTGGHLSSNLGTVELTLALHYVYNTPYDRLIWDVGHQSYTHKILTARKEAMCSLRRYGGLSGFPKRSESTYDTFGTGHSSTSISAALGMAVAARHKQEDRKIVAVIGDGAMSAGQAFEGLNNAGEMDANILVILNDNEMSISAPVGAMNRYLSRLLSGSIFHEARNAGKKVLSAVPAMYSLAKKAEEQLKDMLHPTSLFEEFGFHYIGPIDGHDLNSLIPTLTNIRNRKGPQFLHIVTKKGQGYKLAESEPTRYHGVPVFNPETGDFAKTTQPEPPAYTQVFSDWIVDMATQDQSLMAITPAMCEGSGLVEFSKQFPERFFDVGIAEQHAITFAAGLACEGLKPVLAIYSTFLQRGYDQLIHDVALQKLPVLFAIDRAGIVGPDGATHFGGFDISYLRCIPNLLICTPSDENECRQLLYTAYQSGQTAVVRYPRDKGVGVEIMSDMTAYPIGKARLCRAGHKIAILAFGPLLHSATEIAEPLGATVVDMRFVCPLDEGMILELAHTHTHLVTLEENVVAGGAGSAVSECLDRHRKDNALLILGLPNQFPAHGDRQQLLEDAQLDTVSLLNRIRLFLQETPA